MITLRFRVAVVVTWSAMLALAPLSAYADRARSRPYVGQRYVSFTPKDRAEVEAIWTSASAVIEPHDPAVVEHRVAIHPEALRALVNAGIQARVLDDDVQRLVDQSYEHMLVPSRAGYSGAVPDWFNEVQPLDELYTYLDELATGAAGRASVRVIGEANENEIKVIRISSAPSDEGRGSVLITGTHHAREWISPMVVMGYIWTLTSQYDTDPAVKQIVDNLNVYIVPVQNPDGYVETFNGDRLRRTNLSTSCAAGVDLNRNWDAKDWGKSNVGLCGSETYCGPSPSSEPETKVTKALGDSLEKPLLYIDVHSGADKIMTPYAANRTVAKMYEQAKAAADIYGRVADLPVEPGIIQAQGAGGGALDYFQEQWDERQGIAFVVELPPGPGRSTFDIPADGIPANVDKNAKALIAVLEKLAQDNPAPTTSAGAAGAGGPGTAGVVAAAGQGAAGDAGTGAMVGAAGAPAGAADKTAAVAGSAGTNTQTPPSTGGAGAAGMAVGSMTVGVTAAAAAGTSAAVSGSAGLITAAGQPAQVGAPQAPADGGEASGSSGCSTVTLGAQRSHGAHMLLAMLLFAFRLRARQRRGCIAVDQAGT